MFNNLFSKFICKHKFIDISSYSLDECSHCIHWIPYKQSRVYDKCSLDFRKDSEGNSHNEFWVNRFLDRFDFCNFKLKY